MERENAASGLAHARAALHRNLAAEALRYLHNPKNRGPETPDVWIWRWEIMRAQDRREEIWTECQTALRTGGGLHHNTRREILRAATRSLVFDVPDDQARAVLQRWLAADPTDEESLAALHRRIAANPTKDDPSVVERIAALQEQLARNPGNINVRRALVEALADAGRVDEENAALAAWPADARDARYHRLWGRFAQDHAQPRPGPEQLAAIAASYRRVLALYPVDWRTRARLAQITRQLGDPHTAQRLAREVAVHREWLDPNTLGPRLAQWLDHPEIPENAQSLANLCRELGLIPLADAWLQLIPSPSQTQPPPRKP